MPIAATPLRQVMSKSIQRAIREHVTNSPKSPLDLRISPVVRRNGGKINRKDFKNIDENRTPKSNSKTKRNSIEMRSTSVLETVYETAQNSEVINNCDIENNKNKRIDNIEKVTNSNSIHEIKVTPLTNIPLEENENTNNDVWYTPNENMPNEAKDVRIFLNLLSF